MRSVQRNDIKLLSIDTSTAFIYCFLLNVPNKEEKTKSCRTHQIPKALFSFDIYQPLADTQLIIICFNFICKQMIQYLGFIDSLLVGR